MTRPPGQGHFYKKKKKIMWGIFLFLIQTDAVKVLLQGQEYKCSMELDGNCITKVTWKISEKYTQKGRPFTVSFMSPEGKTENAVLLHYVGYYYCEAAGDHTCDEGNNSTTVSKSTCVTGRQYMLAADGEPAISCTPTHSTSAALAETNNYTTKNTTSVKFVSKEDALQKENGVSGIVVGAVVIILVLTAAGVTYCICRLRRKQKSKNSNPADQIEQEEANKQMLKEHNGERSISIKSV
ncbi:uncharacterized protein LOC112568197 isoform X1 [Pomacea canaliculata]|nr:uncharacterized protein LOC112568197 isoform X1 [Pomacea canaliculata]